MMVEFDEARSEAIERLLLGYVRSHPGRRNRGPQAVGLLLAGAVAGAGASYAAAAGGLLPTSIEQPFGRVAPALPDAIPAPAGVVPGTPVISLLGEPSSVVIGETDADRRTTIGLGDRPAAATHVRVTVTPTGAGRLTYGTDAGGNNPSVEFESRDLRDPSPNWGDAPLDASTNTLYLDPVGFTGVVTIQYVTHIPTHLGVNRDGLTYGSEIGYQGVPDLVAVVAENGRQGYVYRTALEEAVGYGDGGPKDPADAIRAEQERAGTFTTLDVFESDGQTRVGEFTIQH